MPYISCTLLYFSICTFGSLTPVRQLVILLLTPWQGLHATSVGITPSFTRNSLLSFKLFLYTCTTQWSKEKYLSHFLTCGSLNPTRPLTEPFQQPSATITMNVKDARGTVWISRAQLLCTFNYVMHRRNCPICYRFYPETCSFVSGQVALHVSARSFSRHPREVDLWSCQSRIYRRKLRAWLLNLIFSGLMHFALLTQCYTYSRIQSLPY